VAGVVLVLVVAAPQRAAAVGIHGPRRLAVGVGVAPGGELLQELLGLGRRLFHPRAIAFVAGQGVVAVIIDVAAGIEFATMQDVAGVRGLDDGTCVLGQIL